MKFSSRPDVRGDDPADQLETAGGEDVACFLDALADDFEQYGGEFAGALRSHTGIDAARPA